MPVLQEMLAERGVSVDHTTIYRWVQRFSPEMEKRLLWYWRNPSDLCPWHIDETDVKVNGRWAYLYRAVDSRDRTLDFYLPPCRNSKAAYKKQAAQFAEMAMLMRQNRMEI